MNELNLIGRVGQALELKEFSDGTPYCGISIATEKRWKNKETDQWDSRTIWHQVVFTRTLAKNMVKVIQKGDLVRVRAELDYQVDEETKNRTPWIRGQVFDRLHRPKKD